MEEIQTGIVDFPRSGVAIECEDLSDTAALAGFIASSLKSGDVVLLDGELAAGKTTFVTLMCRALGCFDQPSSPTYVISNVYRCPKFEIFHIDAYRLGSVDEFYQLGLEEFLLNSATFIEWGGKVASAFDSCLKIQIDFLSGQGEGRIYRVTSSGSRWRSLVARLADYPKKRAEQL